MLSASKPKCNFGHWSKMTLKSSTYLLPKFSRVPLTKVLIPLISTMINGTLLNLKVIFDQWPQFAIKAIKNYWMVSSSTISDFERRIWIFTNWHDFHLHRISLVQILLLRFFKTFRKYLAYAFLGLFILLLPFSYVLG